MAHIYKNKDLITHLVIHQYLRPISYFLIYNFVTIIHNVKSVLKIRSKITELAEVHHLKYSYIRNFEK